MGVSELAALEDKAERLRRKLALRPRQLAEIHDLYARYVALGEPFPADLEEHSLRLILKFVRPDDAEAARRLVTVLQAQGKPVPEEVGALSLGGSSNVPRSTGRARAIARRLPFARTAWSVLQGATGSIAHHKAASSSMATPKPPANGAVVPAAGASGPEGFEAYQIAALKQMPDIPIPKPSESVSRLPDHVRALVQSVDSSKRAVENRPASVWPTLSQEEFEQALAASAVERGVPLDVLAALFAAGPKLDRTDQVLQLMHTYWRRLVHWQDVRDLAAMMMRRQFDWNGQELPDPEAIRAGQSLRDHGYALLPRLLTAGQAAEAYDYFLSRPGLNRHVPDGCPDPIRRYVGYGADHYAFCSYPLSDIVLAPHLLEALVNPRIAEIGWHMFGAIPRLWKIFTHWDLPGSKFLDHGTSIGHYHRDLNDVGMMWVYVYLSDVDAECGPHGLVPGSQSIENITAWLKQARDLGAETWHGKRYLVPEDFFDGYGYQINLETKEAMFADREAVITGPAGTAFISNGFNYHRIVAPQSKRRLLCAARYYLTHPSQLESPSRDVDKIPFHVVMDRIGDSELIREMTRGVVDWHPPRLPRPQRKEVVHSTKKYFLIISNGRSGSTWLQTSLGRLSGVRTDYEYRWALPRGAEGNPIHYVIPNHRETVVESLDRFSDDARIAGSKLTFSLEWTQRQSVFEKIDSYFDDRITYIFLTRPYLETLASFLLRGPVHQLAKADANPAESSVMLRQLRKVSERSDVTQRAFHGNERDVFRGLKSLVNNDVIGFGICKHFPNRLYISYDRISSEFDRLARAVGWGGDEGPLNDILAAPLVNRLPTLDWSKFPRSDLFSAYSNRLDSTLQTAIDEEWTVDGLHGAQMSILDELHSELASADRSAHRQEVLPNGRPLPRRPGHG